MVAGQHQKPEVRWPRPRHTPRRREAAEGASACEHEHQPVARERRHGRAAVVHDVAVAIHLARAPAVLAAAGDGNGRRRRLVGAAMSLIERAVELERLLLSRQTLMRVAKQPRLELGGGHRLSARRAANRSVWREHSAPHKSVDQARGAHGYRRLDAEPKEGRTGPTDDDHEEDQEVGKVWRRLPVHGLAE